MIQQNEVIKDRKFIYFPSFSAGSIGSSFHKDRYLKDMPARFWASDYPEKHRYPYFLLTAGHDYKRADRRGEFGLIPDTTTVIGDSGGYQIASGAMKWEDTTQQPIIRRAIFEWLENNSDLAMNLDIPPRLNYEGQYKKCLEWSIENFKHFNEWQTGKTQFLNVVQGNDEAEYLNWYKQVKDFEFNGWGIGGAGGSLYRFMSGLLAILVGKEHLKDNNKWLHILGTSKISDFLLISQIQKSFNDVESPMKVTTDSSSPSRATVFGTYYTNFSLKTCRFNSIHIPKRDETFNNPDLKLPYVSEFDRLLIERMNLSELVDFTPESYITMVHHNFHFFLDVVDRINSYVYGHPYLLKEELSNDMFKMMNIVDELIKSNKPYETFQKHKPFILKLSTSLEKNDYETNNITDSSFFSTK